MTRLILFLLCAALAAAAQPKPAVWSPEMAVQGWIRLFDGESVFGWDQADDARWEVRDGALTASAGAPLRTHVPFTDFRLRLEIRSSAAGPLAGVILRDSGQPGTGYALESLAPKAQLAAGRWHGLDIMARGSTFTVNLDGKRVASSKDFRFRAGAITLLQPPGRKLEFRAIFLKPLDLATLFNGNDLAGWRQVSRTPAPAPPAEWSVKDGAIHVEKGPGQLETTTVYDDFILQLDIRANSSDSKRHTNSGIFFRGDPGFFWSGYESQIRNEHELNDPAKPVDFGTGGIYRNQPARRIVAQDNQWFTKTIVASGRNISVWVDGYPVTSWTDSNPEGRDVRAKHARLLRGVISLQAHDPTTNLDFRSILIAALPR